MNYYIDTEFIERGPDYPIVLISIALVSEDGRKYYAISSEFNENDANDWVKENVLAKLGNEKRKPKKQIAKEIIQFIGDREDIKFVGYYSDYDWVVFCQLFGTMMDLPKNFPMYCIDLKQIIDDMGKPDVPEQDSKSEHNALVDTIWVKDTYEFLKREKTKPFNLSELKKYISERRSK